MKLGDVAMSEKTPDANEIMRTQGGEALRDNLIALPPSLPDRTSSNLMAVRALKPEGLYLSLTAFEDIKLDTERRGYLVKGLLPDSGLGVIWGPPKCYKSFWESTSPCTSPWIVNIATARSNKSAVVYIGLEGRQGLPARIEAFKKHYGVDRAPFHLITAPLNLKKQVDVLIADIKAQLTVPPGIVFIDTLNRSLAGSESKDEDMAAYLAAAAKIEQRFNCLVILVHHCGIDGTRPRGHSSLTAAVDVQLAVERLGDRQMRGARRTR